MPSQSARVWSGNHVQWELFSHVQAPPPGPVVLLGPVYRVATSLGFIPLTALVRVGVVGLTCMAARWLGLPGWGSSSALSVHHGGSEAEGDKLRTGDCKLKGKGD